MKLVFTYNVDKCLYWSHWFAYKSLSGKNKSLVSGLCALRLRLTHGHFYFFCYETMSSCSQNCWIDWSFAALCFKLLFYIMGMNVCPICVGCLCVWEIWSGSNTRIYIYMYHVFHWLAKNKKDK